jgi:hypothetical protein
LKLGGSNQIASEEVKISGGYKHEKLETPCRNIRKILRDYDKVKIPANND